MFPPLRAGAPENRPSPLRAQSHLPGGGYVGLRPATATAATTFQPPVFDITVPDLTGQEQERQWSPKSAFQHGGPEEDAENALQNPLGTNGRSTPDGFHRRMVDGVTALFSSLTAERDDESRWEQLTAAVNDPARAFSTPEVPIRSPIRSPQNKKRPSTVSNGGPNRARHSKQGSPGAAFPSPGSRAASRNDSTPGRNVATASPNGRRSAMSHVEDDVTHVDEWERGSDTLEMDFTTPLVRDAWVELCGMSEPAVVGAADPAAMFDTRARLAPTALRSRGMDAAAVSRLYRALLVHSQGFHRAVFDVCERIAGRDALLRDVWEFFVGLWDGSLRVAFNTEVTAILREKRVAEKEAAQAVAAAAGVEERLLELQGAFDEMVRGSLQHALDRQAYEEEKVALGQERLTAVAAAEAAVRASLTEEHEEAVAALEKLLRRQESLTRLANEETIEVRQQRNRMELQAGDALSRAERAEVAERELTARLATAEAATAEALSAGAEAVARNAVISKTLEEREAEYEYKDEEWRSMYRAYNYMKGDLDAKKQEIERQAKLRKQLQVERIEAETALRKAQEESACKEEIIVEQRAEVTRITSEMVVLRAAKEKAEKATEVLKATVETERAANANALALKGAQMAEAVENQAAAHRVVLVGAHNAAENAKQKQAAAEEMMQEYWHALVRKREKKKHWKGEYELAIKEVALAKEATVAANAEAKKEAARLQKRLDQQTEEVAKMRSTTEAAKSKQFMAGKQAKEREAAAAASVADAHKAMAEMEATQAKATAAKDRTIAELRQDVLAADEASDAVTKRCEAEMASMRAYVLEGQQRVAAADRELEQLKKDLREAAATDEATRAAMETAHAVEVEGLLAQMRDIKAKVEEDAVKVDLDKQLRDEMIKQREERIESLEKEVRQLTRAEEKNLLELQELEAQLTNQKQMHQKECAALRQALSDEKRHVEAQMKEMEAQLQLLLPPTPGRGAAGVDPAAGGNPAKHVSDAHGDAYRESIVAAAEAERDAAISRMKFEHIEATNSAKGVAGERYRQLKERLEEELAQMEIDRDEKVKAAQEAESTAKDDLELQQALNKDVERELDESRQETAAARSDIDTLQATIAHLHAQLEATVEGQRLSARREQYCQAMAGILAEKAQQVETSLVTCSAHATVLEELKTMPGGAPLRELPGGQVGDVGRRAGQRYPTDDGCVDTMDAQWHSFSTWLTEAQLSMAKMTQERKVLEDRIASAQNRERDLAGELSSLQKQFKALTDQQAKLALKEKQAVYEKKALQQLVKAGTAASLGLINVKSSAAAAAAVSDADAAEVAAMRHVSKLPQLQAMLEEIEASSPLGDGLKQLEERVGAMNAKIRKVEAKEEELICVVETTLEQLDAIYTVIDELHAKCNALGSDGAFFLESLMNKDRTAHAAMVQRSVELQRKADKLAAEVTEAKGEIDKLTTSLFSSASAAAKGKMAIRRVEDQMEAMAAKHHGELLLRTAHAKMHAATEKILKEQAETQRQKSDAQVKEAQLEVEVAQAESERLRGVIAERDRTIAKMAERTQGHVRQMAAQGQQLMAVQQKKLGRSMSAIERNRLPESAAAAEAQSHWPAAEEVVQHAEMDALTETVRGAMPESSHAEFDRLVAFHMREVRQVRERLAEAKHTILETANAHRQVAAENAVAAEEVRRLETELFRAKLSEGNELPLQLQWVRSAGQLAEKLQAPTLPAEALRVLIAHMYVEKIAADRADDAAGESRQSMRQFVYEYFVLKFGLQTYAELNLFLVIKCVEQFAETEPAVALFGALCGATSAEPPMPPYAIHFYTTFLSKLYASVGAPSAAERAAGRHRLKLEPAVAVVEACLDGCLDPAEHAKLLGRLKIHADGEGADAHIDLGLLSLELMRAWCKEDAVRGERMQQALVDADENRDGRYTYEELEVLLEAISPAGLTTRTMRKVWRDAQAADTSCHGLLLPDALEAAARKNGVGVLPYLLPHMAVATSAPDDLSFLRASWAQLRPMVSALATVQCDAAGSEAHLAGLVSSLDACVTKQGAGELGDEVATEAAWNLYRRLVLAFQARQQVEEVKLRESRQREAGLATTVTGWAAKEAAAAAETRT